MKKKIKINTNLISIDTWYRPKYILFYGVTQSVEVCMYVMTHISDLQNCWPGYCVIGGTGRTSGCCAIYSVANSILKHGDPSRKRLLTAGNIVGGVVRDQRSGPVPNGRRGRDRRPVVLRTPQNVRVEQLVQLVPYV